MKKKIGIVGWSTGENSFGVTKPYLEWIAAFGEPVILLPTSTEVQPIDLLILPGGMDITPQSYGQAPSFFCGNPDVHKQWFYDVMLPKYVNAGTPIFGICLGLQQIVAFFGGKLVQHLSCHEYSSPRTELVHPIRFTKDGLQFVSEQYAPVKKDKKQVVYKVNSMHHQCANCSSVENTDLEVLAYANNSDYPGEYIAEAVGHKTLPIIGVQWHPEEIWDEFATNAMLHLLTSHEPAKGGPVVGAIPASY